MTQRETEDTIAVLTIAETARRLGCSKPHVYRLIHAGVFDPVDISEPDSPRTKTRIRLDDLARYIDSVTRRKERAG